MPVRASLGLQKDGLQPKTSNLLVSLLVSLSMKPAWLAERLKGMKTCKADDDLARMKRKSDLLSRR